jgi:hypothetical protein
MIKILVIIYSILFLFSFNRNEKKDSKRACKYYWVEWKGHEYKKPDSITINIERNQIGDTDIIKYFTKSGGY